LLKDYDLVVKLSDVFNSKAAILNQLIAESEVVILMLEKELNCKYVNVVIAQALSILGRILEHADDSSLDFSDLRDQMVSMGNSCQMKGVLADPSAKLNIASMLRELADSLRGKVNKLTSEFIQETQLDIKEPMGNFKGLKAVCSMGRH
jgi:hypothetical protein